MISALNPLWQRAGRLLLRLRYLLWQRRRHNRLALERALGCDLLILPGVMNPRLFRTGEFLAAELNETLIPPGSHVLDMGTGSGLGAIVAAQWADEVVAVDINPAAVRCANINRQLNGVEDRLQVLRGDLFSPVGSRRFDVVLFNPPFFRGRPQDPFDYAWRSEDTVERFAAALGRHLTPGGYALLVLSSDGDAPAFLRCFEQEGFQRRVVARRALLAETLTVYQFRPREDPCPQ